VQQGCAWVHCAASCHSAHSQPAELLLSWAARGPLHHGPAAAMACLPLLLLLVVVWRCTCAG
jgi:hypothetical protein